MSRLILAIVAALGLALVVTSSADAAVTRGTSAAGRSVELDVTGRRVSLTFITPGGTRLTSDNARSWMIVTNLETGLTQTYESSTRAELAPGRYRIEGRLAFRHRVGFLLRPAIDTVTFNNVQVPQ